MNRTTRNLCVCLSTLAAASTAHAWVNNTGTCPFGESDSYWPSGIKENDICSNWDGLPSATDTGRDWKSAVDALGWAHWNWYRDQTASFYMRLRTSGIYCNSGWMDNTDQKNQIGIIRPTRIDWLDECDVDDWIACVSRDHKDCFGWGDNQMLAADIAFDATLPWAIVSQDSLENCLLSTGYSIENTAIHELGHAYGLAHNEGGASVMNPSKPRIRNCDVSANFHDYPLPDDMGGYLEHHKGYSGAVYNVAGTPWFQAGATASITKSEIPFTASGPAFLNVPLTYSLHSFYPDRIAEYRVEYFWLPLDYNTWQWRIPTFNASTKQWSMPGAKFAPEQTIVQNSGRSTSTQSINLAVLKRDFPVNILWRLWVRVDSLGQVSERNEGDNVFPTDVVIGRSG